MNLGGLLGTRKIFYVLAGAIILLVLFTVILILRNVGGEPSQANLEFWGVYDTKQDFSKINNSFQAINPGIKVNYKQFSYEDYEKALIDALATGAGPDVLMIHNTWLAKHRTKFAPMPNPQTDKNPFITPKQFQDQFVDVAYKDLVYQDKIYALPLYVDTLALFYNKDMFNTAGIPRPPQDWEEFNKDVELLTKFDQAGNIIQAGAAMGTARNINRSTDILSALMIQSGVKMNNTANTGVSFTRSVDGKRVGENSLQYYTDFANPLKTVYAWNDKQHYSIDSFVEGKVAMMFNYSHQVNVLRQKLARLNFNIAPMPQFSELDSKSYANYWAVGVSNTSKNQEAAWRYLSYLASKDGAMQYLIETSRPSARRDIIENQKNDPAIGVFAFQALSAKSWFQIDNNAIDGIFADMIDEVNSKKATVRAALRSAESKINTLMSKQAQ
ncbi:MAG: extracellular solute-binding protein [Candidatus Yanofskybacteria bacterium]|nr:extracellular solute-binding protein [Candidatus Yanofskybacteria bacterium]